MNRYRVTWWQRRPPAIPQDGPLRPPDAPLGASRCRGRRPGGPQGGRPGQAAPRPPSRDAHLDSRAGRNLLAAVHENRLDPAWLLLATLGMRRGELLGLRWVDVDLNEGHIATRHTLVTVD